MYSLKSKLSLSYVMVTVLCILLISGLTNFFLDKHFREYVRQNQEKNNKKIVSELAKVYENNDGWDYYNIEATGVSALENGLILRVKDVSGQVIWDATEHNNGMCQRIIEQMASNVSSRYPYIKGYYTEIPYDIFSRLSRIGTAEIGYYGPYYLSDNDLAFINTLNRLLLGVGFFSLLFSLGIGHLMAKRLSAPISKVIKSTESIENGCYSDRITSKSNTKEINQLTSTINNLAETMENQEALRKRLTGDLAHELRTPLATLQSHIEAMIDGIWKADTQRLTSCHDEIVRISRLVGDLEKLARYESENLILNKESFDVTELIKSLMRNFEKDFLNKEISIEFSSLKQVIYADKDKISQVIVNLLSNAWKYTPQGGRVRISVKKLENSTLIVIEDNGSGISGNDLPYIFERFYRADESRNRLTGGTGIGLTIAKAIITAHKGTIEVKSGKDTGTRFTISLPG